ncbi:hypothetical protein NVIE_003850 [Nitrososphaera viennensis EN76]|uniref:Uncharacterized protein n=1 Tax=Nitrososphaera viennensis EN76 TaxID=926571 RepID=A0A060HG49_9ARCH|nr:hypothetical protein NVIE_003850 [Nitrososphaera viennensis EN76]
MSSRVNRYNTSYYNRRSQLLARIDKKYKSEQALEK